MSDPLIILIVAVALIFYLALGGFLLFTFGSLAKATPGMWRTDRTGFWLSLIILGGLAYVVLANVMGFAPGTHS